MARKSLLPEAGENKFQRIKRQQAEATTRGIKLIKLSIGQPEGPALLTARLAAAKAVQSDTESMHEYQDNGSPGVPDFARRFAQVHVRVNLDAYSDSQVDYLPIPGIKPMLGVVINSLGAWHGARPDCSIVGTMTRPGYPTPADQCAMANAINQFPLWMEQSKGFLFDINDLDLVSSVQMGEGDLLMLNFPHNPTGIVARREWLEKLCKYCSDKGIRIFNDAAYAILTHVDDAVTLTDVAVNFPELSWAEAFSASKAGNNTGWRIGAMAGSPDFIGDIKRIKGNTDSGFAAPLAAGIIDLYENHRTQINDCRLLYAARLSKLVHILNDNGMRLAVKPEAGFFVLCDCPSKAFGMEIKSAEQFNALMIENTGVVGVPFDEDDGKKYIRYAVCTTDIDTVEQELQQAFAKAAVSYQPEELPVS